MPAALPSTSLSAGGTVRALGADPDRVLVATDAGTFVPVGGELRPVGVVGTADEPAETGAVRALARRQEGFFVAAEAGLFHTLETRLALSPLSAGLDGLEIRGLDAVGAGETEELWIATADGLVHAADGSIDHLDLEGAVCAPTAVAAVLDRVLVGCGEALYEIDPSAATWARVPHVLGTIIAIEDAGDGWAALATTGGLVMRDPAGAYTLYTLTDTEDAGASVSALAVDPSIGVVASIEDGLLAAVPGAPPVGIAPLPASGARSLAVDGQGTIWVGDAETLTSIPLGEPVSFTGDVAPFFDRWCNDCHAAGVNGAPKHDYGDLDTVTTLLPSILIRLAQGSMPPSGARPSEEDVELLLRWARTGMSP